MHYFNIIVLLSLIVFSIAISFIKNLFSTVIVFMIYSLMMTVVWQQLNSPDLAITEAAVGAGITSFLFIAALKKIKEVKK
ncbi:MAG: DUF4040 domain-containing protein [Tissierellales bacterium]|nr:DUF4040 domain-containing protein [Tissierellales bacterium]MBN2828128.1 DUF4040 domain-containing protein [Tissierellales bacterium]